MPQYLYVYHGGATPQNEADAAQEMAAWNAWLSQMGEAVVIPGNPVGQSKTVTAEGIADHGGSNPMSGYTVVEAETLAEAAALAKGCPMVLNGSGSVEVAEIIEI
jgi:hypothetical protein